MTGAMCWPFVRRLAASQQREGKSEHMASAAAAVIALTCGRAHTITAEQHDWVLVLELLHSSEHAGCPSNRLSCTRVDIVCTQLLGWPRVCVCVHIAKLLAYVHTSLKWRISKLRAPVAVLEAILKAGSDAAATVHSPARRDCNFDARM